MTYRVYSFENGTPRREAEVDAESLGGALEHFAAHRHPGAAVTFPGEEYTLGMAAIVESHLYFAVPKYEAASR